MCTKINFVSLFICIDLITVIDFMQYAFSFMLTTKNYITNVVSL